MAVLPPFLFFSLWKPHSFCCRLAPCVQYVFSWWFVMQHFACLGMWCIPCSMYALLVWACVCVGGVWWWWLWCGCVCVREREREWLFIGVFDLMCLYDVYKHGFSAVMRWDQARSLESYSDGMPVMMMNWCLMSSDVSWHIRDKLWPMPKHGSIILYIHGNQKAH